MPANWTESQITFSPSQQLIGFYGTEGPQTINSLAAVEVIAKCSIEADSFFTNTGDTTSSSAALSSTDVVWLVVGTTLGVLAIVGIALAIVLNIRRKNKDTV